MFCPNCGASCDEEQRFCMYCGTGLNLRADDVIIERPVPKKGSLWAPLLILIALSIAGIALFFITAGKPNPAAASDTPWFTLREGELYFDESRYTGDSEITVPSEIGGEPVRALSDGCFAWCDEITTVHLPDSLESIGQQAFEGCTAMRGIFIPESVTHIGDGAFNNCTGLEAISVPMSLESVGHNAFDNCDHLYYIFYPGSIDEWTLLYGEFINPYTGVYCEGGSFYQGGTPFE